MSNITGIGTANPSHRFKQSQIADFMVKAMQLNNEDTRKLRTVFNASGIEYRHSVLEDYRLDKDYTFYANTVDFEPFPTTSKRLELFREHALNLSAKAVDDMLIDVPGFDLQDITHLIVVSCTGLYAPGLDIDLVKKLGLADIVQRTAINFMGCYAAFNAMKVADAFCCQDPEAKVLIVCTELCSLHFQKLPTEDNMISNALFADGAAAILMEGRTNAKVKLIPQSFCTQLMVNSSEEMAWTVGDFGFEMRLSSYIPAIIKGGISSLANKLLSKANKSISDIRYFAIHPGGRKILENIEKELKLDKKQNQPAYHVLRNYGNMSSPTVLFVLDEIKKGLTPEDNEEYIMSFAFGPGLTLESVLLKIEMDVR